MPDKYSNVAHIQVTEPTINTLTYRKLETGIALFEKMAWIISRIEYYWMAPALAVTTDGVEMAITTSNNPAALTPDQVAVIDMSRIVRFDMGTASSGMILTLPMIRDFSELPGRGLIVPPNPIYLAVQGIGQPAVVTMDCRIYYTAIQLKGDEFWELVEARRIISST